MITCPTGLPEDLQRVPPNCTSSSQGKRTKTVSRVRQSNRVWHVLHDLRSTAQGILTSQYTMPDPLASTRDRIITAASALFYGQGIRAVSMDGVAAKAGITKKTLYYHFRSKDDLIAAYLEERDGPNLRLFQRWFEAADGDVADKIRSVFAQLAAAARHRNWKGCGFLRTAVELFELPGHPAIVAGRAHKRRVEDWLCAILEDHARLREPRGLARQLILLMDGAFAVVLLHRDASYMETAGDAAVDLIRGRAMRAQPSEGINAP